MTSRDILFGIVLISLGKPGLVAQQLPAAETVLDKFVQVTGGAAAYRQIRNETSSGSVDFTKRGAGITFAASSGNFTQYRVEPNQSATELTLPNLGGSLDNASMGSNGTTTWMMSSNACGGMTRTGPVLAEADERAFSVRTSSPSSPTNWRTLYSKVETTGTDSVDGRQCYRVALTPQQGSQETNCYDAQSGFLLKTSTVWRSSAGNMPVELTFGDYRKEGRVVMPHKRSITYAGQTTTYTVRTVKFNTTIPSNKFTPPKEVTALIK